MKKSSVKSGNDKYGLSQMKLKSHKDFKVSQYSVIRLAAWYRGTISDRKYSTRKMKNESGRMVIRVFCGRELMA